MSRFEPTDSFFEDEIREGFYIPAVMKKAWGAQLRVLNEIDRVCVELGIKYFATWGTFLGAVRHGGYVPWDDDLDICMLRDDYDHFLEEGIPLLSEGYTVYNHKSRADHLMFVANVVARENICFEEEYLKEFHGFPYIVGVDVFQLDYMSPDPKEHQLFRLRSMLVQKVAGDIFQGKLEGKDLRNQLKQLEETIGIRLPDGMDPNEVRRILDIKTVELFSYYVGKKERAEKIVQMMPCGFWDDDFYILPAKYYRKQTEIPFEMGKMPVPLYYEPAVRKHYREYMKVYKGGAAHSYPYFEAMREEMQALSGNELPEYHVNVEALPERRTVLGSDTAHPGESYRDVVNECLGEMESLQAELKSLVNTIGICAELQQLAVDLGTYMEAVKGEGYDIVGILEKYCEALYGFSQENTTEALSAVNGLFHEASEKIRVRKEILFLPFKGKYWKAFETEYKKWATDLNADVYVVPIPYYYKDYLGQLYDMQYDFSEYPADLPRIHYDEYDLALHHPDRIYIQNPYDQWNEITSVPPAYFSDKLLAYTERLIYIPWFRTYDFTREDGPQYFNMKYYCNMPGVINADEVILQSRMIKDAYIEKLCEFVGEETREIWEKKLMVADPEPRSGAGKEPDEKILLYYQDFSDVLLYAEQSVEKLQAAVERFKGQKEYEKMIILKSALIDEELKKLEPELYEHYTEALAAAASVGAVEVRNESTTNLAALVEACSAFCGDAGRIAHMFNVAGKPVEIQEYE